MYTVQCFDTNYSGFTYTAFKMKQRHGSGDYYRAFSFRNNEFDPRSVNVGFVVDKVALGDRKSVV
jgi:hypothetical protein